MLRKKIRKIILSLLGFLAIPKGYSQSLLGHVALLESYPIHENLFIQGLELDEQGKLFLSKGLYKESAWGTFDLSEGKFNPQKELEDRYFAEGITLFGDDLWQLTWKENKVFKWNKNSGKLLETYPIDHEGWGIAFNDKTQQLIVSDGTSQLYFYEPERFELMTKINVKLEGKSIERLNELEYADGYLYANVWYNHHILKIDPENGEVVKLYDLDPILQSLDLTGQQRSQMDALNGIAHVEGHEFYLTGKNYPVMMKVRLD